jgi:glycosyltransferase involved in cell wall biosynthesis
MAVRDMYLIVFAPVYGPSGYANLARGFILELDKLGVKIKLEPNKLWEPHEAPLPAGVLRRLKELERTVIPKRCTPPKLSLGIAPWFDKSYPGYKIGYTMFEFSNVPNVGKYDWKTACLQMDEVWTPSTYNLQTFNDNGINNVVVMPPGIYVDQYNSTVEPLIEKDDRVRFLSVSEYTPRKGFDLLLPAYLAEFTSDDKVSLILKAYNGSKKPAESKRIIKEDIIRYRREAPNVLYPHILFIGDIIGDDKMPGLYTSADIFVLLTRGEGFGLPMAESMACGLPCILPDNSSYLDFVNNDNGYLVKTDGLESYADLHKASVLYKNSMSPVIDVLHARKLMRNAYENIVEARAKGSNGRSTIEDNFNWTVAGARMYKRLQEINEYWIPQQVSVVTDNFEELILDDSVVVERQPEDMLNINVIYKGAKGDNVAMLIPSWGDNCGVADYTRELIERINGDQNITIVKNIYNLADTVKRQGINMVHIQHHYAFYSHQKLIDTIEMLKMMKVKVIMTIHDLAVGIGASGHNASFSKCDLIIVHSDMIKQKIISECGVKGSNVEVMIMGCDSRYALDKAMAKNNIKMTNKKIIASFGFLQPHKNWVEVVKAIPMIKKEIPEILYLIISVVKRDNSAIHTYDVLLDDTIRRLGVSDYVKRFKNPLSEERILQMLAASDVIVLPYDNYRINNIEYWGMSIASRFSMRVQRPLLVSNVSFFADLQNVAEIVTPSATAISNSIINLLNDENLQRKVVLRQYSFSNSNSWESFGNKLIKIYKKIREKD